MRSTFGSILALLLGFGLGWMFSDLHNHYLSGKATILIYNATGYQLNDVALLMPDGASHPLCDSLPYDGWHWDSVPRSGSGALRLSFALEDEPAGARSVKIPGSRVGRAANYDDAVSIVLDGAGFRVQPANAAAFRQASRQEERRQWREALRRRFGRDGEDGEEKPEPEAEGRR